MSAYMSFRMIVAFPTTDKKEAFVAELMLLASPLAGEMYHFKARFGDVSGLAYESNEVAPPLEQVRDIQDMVIRHGGGWGIITVDEGDSIDKMYDCAPEFEGDFDFLDYMDSRAESYYTLYTIIGKKLMR